MTKGTGAKNPTTLGVTTWHKSHTEETSTIQISIVSRCLQKHQEKGTSI